MLLCNFVIVFPSFSRKGERVGVLLLSTSTSSTQDCIFGLIKMIGTGRDPFEECIDRKSVV